MKQQTLKSLAKQGKVEEVKEPKKEGLPDPSGSTGEDIANAVKAVEEYLPLIQSLRTVRQPVGTAPTYTPKNWLEMFVFYDDGTNRRLYVWVGTTWRYVALT